MTRTAVIIQPCFFPWRGQFDLLSRADVVVFLDTVQYVRRSWYNRNRIVTEGGMRWITVPVRSKGQYHSAIADIEIDQESDWAQRILTTLEHAYKRYPHYAQYRDSLTELLSRDWMMLSDLARASVEWSCQALQREQRFVLASQLDVESEEPIGRLVALCQAVEADAYLSGPAAQSYIGDSTAFSDAGIDLRWMNYDYPDYPQIREAEDELSVLDLLFNTGDQAPRYIWPDGSTKD